MTRTDTLVVGVGKYGKPATKSLAELKKNIIIVGTPRTGKTRQANSIARQHSTGTGSGQIVINFKPESAFVAEKARDAERLGRSFLHFSMAPKGIDSFAQAHPYEPPRPCHYDPLSRGSGALRARMLIDSVVHDDASDVYRRTAIEVSALCWDIATVVGKDLTRYHPTANTTKYRQRPALEVLLEMLDMDQLQAAAAMITTDLILARHPHLHPDDAERKRHQYVSRAETIVADGKQRSTITSSAIADTRSLVGSLVNSSAFYAQTLSEGAIPSLRIDLLRAIARGEIVVFSLAAADYQHEAAMLGSMILLDLQNASSTLRQYKAGLEYERSADRPDENVWAPWVLQIEELGSAANAASAEALIGVCNKSADVGALPITSTQSLSDLRTIGDGDTYLHRLLDVTSDLMSLQIGSSTGDADVSDFSGKVIKKVPAEQTQVSNSRTGLFTGARQAKTVRGTDTEQPRIPYGTAQKLATHDAGDIRELLWVTKTPQLTAVHTTGSEGPNNWYETLQMVPVAAPPFGYTPFADPRIAAQSRAAAATAAENLLADLHNPQSLAAQLQQLHSQLVATPPTAQPASAAATTADHRDAPPPFTPAADGAATNEANPFDDDIPAEVSLAPTAPQTPPGNRFDRPSTPPIIDEF